MTDNALHAEDALFGRLVKGDESAFRQLYQAHWQNVYGVALTYTKSTAQAQDIVQEVFLRLWEKRAELPPVRQVDNYLFIIARNLNVSSMRKKAVTADADPETGAGLPDDYFLGDHHIIAKQSEAAIQRSIEHLTPKQKEIFILSRENGLSHDEIARQLGINRFTVKNHIVAALNTLRQHLSKEETLLLIPMGILYGITF